MTTFCRSVFLNKFIFNKIFLSVACAGLFLLTSPAMAQMGMATIPQFVPASGWQVQKTPLSQLRGLEKINLPCMMAASYDNGYIVRFSGSQGKMLAMAIDFRQKVFAQGRKYSAKLDIDGSYQKTLNGTAFSNSTLIFNLRDLNGFYNAVSGANKMQLNVEENPMDFAMGGIGNALKQLESCASGNSFSNPSATIQKASLPPPAWAKPTAAQPSMASPRGPTADSAVMKAQAWQAKAGDDMRETLEAWGARAGVKLEWQATNAGKVVSDISVNGTFEEAVQTLMAQNAAALGLDANMRGMNNSMGVPQNSTISSQAKSPQSLLPRISSPVAMGQGGLVPLPSVNKGKPMISSSVPSVTPREPFMAQRQSGHSAGGKWSAPAGASLQQILKGWSKKEGVELIWESNQGFSVIRSIKLGGTYQEALQTLLGQYSGLRIRPAANLNNDPVTGRKTLFVQSSRVL